MIKSRNLYASRFRELTKKFRPVMLVDSSAPLFTRIIITNSPKIHFLVDDLHQVKLWIATKRNEMHGIKKMGSNLG
jgi:hypothetical protein